MKRWGLLVLGTFGTLALAAIFVIHSMFSHAQARIPNPALGGAAINEPFAIPTPIGGSNSYQCSNSYPIRNVRTGEIIGCVGLALNRQGVIQGFAFPSDSTQYHVGKFELCSATAGDSATACSSIQTTQENGETLTSLIQTNGNYYYFSAEIDDLNGKYLGDYITNSSNGYTGG